MAEWSHMHLGKVWAIRESKQVLTLPFLSFVCSFCLPPSFPVFHLPISTFPNISSSSLCILEAEYIFFRQDPWTFKYFYSTSDSFWLPSGCVCTHMHIYAFVCVSDNIFFPFHSQTLFIHSLSLLVLFPSILRGNIYFIPPFPLLPSIQNNK